MRADRKAEEAPTTRKQKDKNTGVLRHKGKALGTYSIGEEGKKLTIWFYAR
jgi:hypothetical protein